MKSVLRLLLLAGGLISGTWTMAQFTDVSNEAGVGFIHTGPEGGLGIDELAIGTGAVWFDYNNDLLLDLYITVRDGSNRLYQNQGNGTFLDLAAFAGVEDAGGDGGGAVTADIDNDGDLDLFLANSDEDVLFVNNGDGTFQDITPLSKLDETEKSRGTSASFGDYNNDGFIDLFIAHHDPFDEADATRNNFLFRNNGDWTFTDETDTYFDPDDQDGFSFIGGWSDYDDDGDLDLILINDCGYAGDISKLKFFENDINDTGTFIEKASTLGLNECDNGMGLAVGDYDNDGDMDFAHTNIGAIRLWRNDGMSGYFNYGPSTGVSNQEPEDYTWGTSFVDLDLDSHLDLIVAHGDLDTSDGIPQVNQIFMSNGDETFTDEAAIHNLNDVQRTRTMAYGDYDFDGDQDLVIVNYNGNVRLMRNDIVGGNFLIINLVGTISNAAGIGSKVKILLEDGTWRYFETRSGSNLGAGDALYAVFGLGENTTVDSIVINWPSGIEQPSGPEGINSTITIIEDESLLNREYLRLTLTGNGYFVQSQIFECAQLMLEFNKDSHWIPSNERLNCAESENYHPFLTGSSTKWARAKAIKENGELIYSNLLSIADEETSPSLFPNPISRISPTLFFNWDGSEGIQHIELVDLQGTKIEILSFESDAQEAQYVLNLPENLPTGLYIINISSPQQTYTQKILFTD